MSCDVNFFLNSNTLILCAGEGHYDDAIPMDEDRYERGFADAFDGDEVTPLERAMSYLLPDASINRIQSSIATIPVPQRMSADDVVVQGPREDRMRPGNIFTPSEIAMIEFAIESRLTRKQTKGLVKLVQEPGFHPEEISSDVHHLHCEGDVKINGYIHVSRNFDITRFPVTCSRHLSKLRMSY